ncbi:MAG: glycosyltransferase family 2 protein [Deltaproteobacteria bacterium]|nr:glycosyltransferase family 2 protein [Deltaproteobacteria bacterium]
MVDPQAERDALSSVWWVVPVHNDGTTVRAVVRECRQLLDHVVVVDDGSTDVDLRAVLADVDVTVLSHDRNRGKGQAIRTGIEYVKSRGGRIALTIDADGQHFPRDLESFLPDLRSSAPALIVGARRFEETQAPRSSRFGRRFGNFWLWVESGVWLDDCQSGFRAYPVEQISRIRCMGSRFDFEAEILARAVWAGLPLRSVPIAVHYPPPHLRVSRFRPFVDNLRLTRVHTRLVLRRLLPIPHRRLV